jgi:putative DNA primase/helicase
MAHHEKTAFAARGKWKGVLAQLGMDMSYLSGKHGPCPICKDGQDRFRFDNREQRGTWICNVCGAGDGMDLVMKAWGFDFKDAASRIDAIVGNAKDDPKPKPELTQDQVRNAMMNVWRNSVPAAPGDLVHRYLASRHIDEVIYPKALRFARSLMDGDGGIRPCMVAMVTEASGEKVVQMHRTFLKPDGSGKAEMQAPRKLLPGELPEGCAIRLSEYNGHGALGIAEGIETALSASAMFDLPVWAAINAGNLAKWEPPAGCVEVAIFGDNDPKFAGQAASYALARRLASKKLAVTVHIPLIAGTDWADEWMATRRKVRI